MPEGAQVQLAACHKAAWPRPRSGEAGQEWHEATSRALNNDGRQPDTAAQETPDTRSAGRAASDSWLGWV